eukprot:ANDGO_04551.mRNA.1 Calpain-like protease palB/RIM13
MVGDCSLLSSLIVAAVAQSSFPDARNLLIDNIVQSGCKYSVKLFFNGAWRVVDVDDTFPASRVNDALVSVSNTNALWVSLIEKAVMHVLIGYDRPKGSSNATDFHMLTGWIPEVVDFEMDGFDKDFYWFRVLRSRKECHAVAMLATGESVKLRGAQQSFKIATGGPATSGSGANSSQDDLWGSVDTCGLVAMHSYAILDVFDCAGQRLVKIKNPWARYKWMGRYSRYDRVSWTKDLIRETGYDPVSDYLYDNGVFFMHWDDVCAFFRNITICWNPASYPYQETLHGSWKHLSNIGNYSDLHRFRNNPQFLLKVDAMRHAEVLLVVSKHVHDWDLEHDAITAIHLFRRADGQHGICITQEVLLRTAYFNGRDNTARFDVPRGSHEFIVVVSLYEPRKVNFSLQAFCEEKMSIHALPAVDPSFAVSREYPCMWNESEFTAGGSISSSTFYRNPQFVLQFASNNSRTTNLRLELETVVSSSMVSQDCGVRIDLHAGADRVESVDDGRSVGNTGSYIKGLTEIQLRDVSTDRPLTVVCSQYVVRTLPFTLRVYSSSCDVAAYLLPREGDGLIRYELRGSWDGVLSGGSPNHPTFFNNPTYSISSPQRFRARMRLRIPDEDRRPSPPAIGICIFSPPGGKANLCASALLKHKVASTPVYHNRRCGTVLDVEFNPGTYIIVISTFSPNEFAPFEYFVFTSIPVTLTRIR